MPLSALSTRELVATAMWPDSHKLTRLPATKSRYGEPDGSSPQASPASSVPSSTGSYVPSHTRCRSVSSTYAESLTYSASTLSSRPSTPGAFPCSPRGALFEPWISSQSPRFPGEDHLHGHLFTPSHSRNPSLDSQVHGMVGYIHRPKSPRGTPVHWERSASFDLPFRIRTFDPKDPLPEDEEEDVVTEGAESSGTSAGCYEDTRPSTADSHRHESLFGKGRRKLSNFLMAPPPPRLRKSYVEDKTSRARHGSSTCEGADESADANVVALDDPDPLVRQICCNILMDLHGIDAIEATVPLKVWDAVVRCLEDVSVAVDGDSAGRSPGKEAHKAAAGAGNSAASTPGHSGSGDSTSRKRNSRQAGYSDGDGSGDGAAEDEGGDDGAVHEEAQRKKPKVEPEQSAFSCPFRKRNPLRFNIRDHEHCCRKPIIGVPELKRHIRTYHRREAPSLYQCRRCKKGFPNEDALDQHSMLPLDQMCRPSSRPQSDDPEDGITEDMDKILAGRKANTKVQTWDQIWRLIFPDVDIIAPVFEQVIEHFEVKRELNKNMATLRGAIQDELRQYIPDMGDFILFSLQKSIETAVEIYTATALRNCRNRVNAQVSSSSPTEKRQGRQPGGSARKSTARSSTVPEKAEQATVTATFRSIAPKPSTSETVSVASPPSEQAEKGETMSPAVSDEPLFMSNELPLRQFQTSFANSKTEDSNQRDSGIVIGCHICLDESGTCGCYEGSPVLDFSMFDQPDEPQACETSAFNQGCGPMSTSPCPDDLALGEPGEVIRHSFQQTPNMPFGYMPGYDSF